jgi:tetratricopeptide (TPR) repeat protein
VIKVIHCPACGTELSADAESNGICPRCSFVTAESYNPVSSNVTPSATDFGETKSESHPDVIHADMRTQADELESACSPGLPPSLSGYIVIGPPKRGGMGTVWPAKQLGTKRTVAIKILGTQQLTSGGRARFEREVELSAQLQHPNIARIYDSGIHQGDYYYAMEMIDGLPLDAYVRKKKLNERQILELMRLVCLGVQHAHVRGVIHCDLKPDNILVSEDGQPHVLDFGLARLTTTRPDGLTENGSAPGTPSWMSPEQAAGQLECIDTRSDVYSLGKILYHFLTGQSPHRLDGPIGDVLHRIATEDVRDPVDAYPKLKWELRALLLKALHRDPERRYSSAGELGNDIERFQSTEPISAVSATTLYFLRKSMARHRLLVASAMVTLLVLASIGTYSYFRIAEEAATTRAVSQYLQEVLGTIDPKISGGRDVTAELLARADADLPVRFKARPLIEAEIRQTIGHSLLSLGQFAVAEAHFQRAVELRRWKLGDNDPKTLAALRELAEACREQGKLEEAVSSIQAVLRSCETNLGPNHRETLRARVTLAYVLNDLGHGSSAEQPIRDAFNDAGQRFGPTDADTLAAAGALVLVLRDEGDAGKLQEAKELAKQVLVVRQNTLPAGDPARLQAVHDLATVLSRQHEFVEAERLFTQAINLGEKMLTSSVLQNAPAHSPHPDLLIWNSDLAYTLHAQGRYKEAEAIYRRILPASLGSRGERHRYNIALRASLAAVLLDQQSWADAERLYREVLQIQEDVVGPQDELTLFFRDAVARALSGQGKWAEAVQIYEQTLEARKNKYAADDPRVASSEENLRLAKLRQARAQQKNLSSGQE